MLGKLFLLIIVALGIGMAVPSTRQAMMDKAQPVLDNARGRLVPSRLDAMADQLEARVGRGEGFPNNWPGWLQRDYTGVPEDPWGNLYYLDNNRSGFTVGSMGPDGQKGTEDDIKEERRFRR